MNWKGNDKIHIIIIGIDLNIWKKKTQTSEPKQTIPGAFHFASICKNVNNLFIFFTGKGDFIFCNTCFANTINRLSLKY